SHRIAGRLRSGCHLAQGRPARGGCLPHRETFVLLPRGAARQDRRRDARISRCGQKVRSRGGLQEISLGHSFAGVHDLWLANNSFARTTCGPSDIFPSIPTAPAPGCAAKAATTAFAFSISAAVGVNTSLITGT